jgi:hypothetical protein
MLRTREIGIRIALGATRFNIVSLVVEHAMPMTLRLTSGLLFGVGPFDPVTLVTVAAVMAGVSPRRRSPPFARHGSGQFRFVESVLVAQNGWDWYI